MKVCKVPLKNGKPQGCPDPRNFYGTMHALSMVRTVEESKQVMKSRNELCEMLNCPYLKERNHV